MKKRQTGFTLMELLVVVAIAAILAAVLFPVFLSAREKARASACLSNFHQIGLAIHQYASDWDDATPPNGSSFGGLIADCAPYAKNTAIFACPDDFDRVKEGRPGTYRMPDLYQGKPLGCGWTDPYDSTGRHIAQSSAATLAYEAEQDRDAKQLRPIIPTYRHSGGTQILLFDGHARWLKGSGPKDDKD